MWLTSRWYRCPVVSVHPVSPQVHDAAVSQHGAVDRARALTRLMQDHRSPSRARGRRPKSECRRCSRGRHADRDLRLPAGEGARIHGQPVGDQAAEPAPSGGQRHRSDDVAIRSRPSPARSLRSTSASSACSGSRDRPQAHCLRFVLVLGFLESHSRADRLRSEARDLAAAARRSLLTRSNVGGAAMHGRR